MCEFVCFIEESPIRDGWFEVSCKWHQDLLSHLVSDPEVALALNRLLSLHPLPILGLDGFQLEVQHMKNSFFESCLACNLVELEIVKSRWITAFDTILEHFQIVS